MVRWIKIQSMNVWGSIKYERTNSVSLYLRMCQGRGLVESILIGQIKKIANINSGPWPMIF